MVKKRKSGHALLLAKMRGEGYVPTLPMLTREVEKVLGHDISQGTRSVLDRRCANLSPVKTIRRAYGSGEVRFVAVADQEQYAAWVSRMMPQLLQGLWGAARFMSLDTEDAVSRITEVTPLPAPGGVTPAPAPNDGFDQQERARQTLERLQEIMVQTCDEAITGITQKMEGRLSALLVSSAEHAASELDQHRLSVESRLSSLQGEVGAVSQQLGQIIAVLGTLTAQLEAPKSTPVPAAEQPARSLLGRLLGR